MPAKINPFKIVAANINICQKWILVKITSNSSKAEVLIYFEQQSRPKSWKWIYESVINAKRVLWF